jgi:rare lipoprotein A
METDANCRPLCSPGIEGAGWSRWAFRGSSLPRRRLYLAALFLALAFLLAGCGHKKTARVSVPPPPQKATHAEPSTESRPPTPETSEITIPPHAKPIYVEVGLASWYGMPYHNRAGANDEIYDMHAMTAAHRTLPLNSIVRVTNLKTGHTAVVRITDRGPFIEGRILDLSFAAAKQVDVWLPGTAKLRIEVFQAPASLDHGGRWCVQIGAFSERTRAVRFKEELQRRYRSAQVIQFPSPTGYWVRVKLKDDDKNRAESLVRDTEVPEGKAFLVRMD